MADREASYPPEVENVSHDPWRPVRGDDVRVTMRLAPDAKRPETVSLLFCRVEPTYVCGIPFSLAPKDEGRTWTGVIEWNPRCKAGGDRPGCEFMLAETVHVGYNLTLRYGGADERRVSAPVANYWVPSTYPSDSEGVYYFMRYEEAEASIESPLPWVVAWVALAVLVGLVLRRRP